MSCERTYDRSVCAHVRMRVCVCVGRVFALSHQRVAETQIRVVYTYCSGAVYVVYILSSVLCHSVRMHERHRRRERKKMERGERERERELTETETPPTRSQSSTRIRRPRVAVRRNAATDNQRTTRTEDRGDRRAQADLKRHPRWYSSEISQKNGGRNESHYWVSSI